jgi:hypothetical protein
MVLYLLAQPRQLLNQRYKISKLSTLKIRMQQLLLQLKLFSLMALALLLQHLHQI